VFSLAHSCFTLKDLRKKWLETKKIDLDYYIIGLYIFKPAIRSDYAGSKLEDNIIKLKTIKVDTGINEVELPEELNDFKHLHNELTKINNNYLCKKVERASTKIFGKRLTINIFRKIWVANVKNANNELEERIELARQMRHTLFVSRDVYETK